MAGMSGLGSLLSDLAYFSVLPGTGNPGVYVIPGFGGGYSQKVGF